MTSNGTHGKNETSYPTLIAAKQHSLEMINLARERIADLHAPYDYLVVVALGSYGRLEAHDTASDFEWLVIYDDRHVNIQEAITAQSALTAIFAELFGRERLSVNKTFGQLCDFTELGTLIGGLAETNRMLTYRVLTLTEGNPLSPGDGYERTIEALASVYGKTHTAGHRLLSLATELARYYRAVRASYKYKIDEEGKPWGVRSIKHRSLRRFAYFSSALHFVALGPRIDYQVERVFDSGSVAAYLRGMNQPPCDRLIEALKTVGANIEIALPSLATYERIHKALASTEVRNHLDSLQASERFDDTVFCTIRADCVSLHTGLAELVLQLPSYARGQVLEMFLL
jgi:hypothetical protein